MSARAAMALAALGLVLPVSTAAAQACAGGRERVDAHCCWPGQTWSQSERACVGVPRCPAGTVEEGETCVAGSAPAPSPTPPAEAQSPVIEPNAAALPATSGPADTSGWPETPGGRPDAMVDPSRVRGTDMGFVIAGSILFGVGYGLGFAVAAAHEVSGNCPCRTWPFAFIPAAGGILSSALSPIDVVGYAKSDGGLGIGLGAPAAAIQITGIAFFLFAVAGYTSDVAPGYRLGPSARLHLDVGAPGADAGVGVHLAF